MSDRWGWARAWDQLAIVGHTCATVDVVEEVLVVRLWDPRDPDREVVRVSLDEAAARKLAVKLLAGATAAEWETMARGLEQLLRERAASSAPPLEVPLPPEDEEDAPRDGVEVGACATCGARAMTLEDQPDPAAPRWLASCGARWIAWGKGLSEVLKPCPTLAR